MPKKDHRLFGLPCPDIIYTLSLIHSLHIVYRSRGTWWSTVRTRTKLIVKDSLPCTMLPQVVMMMMMMMMLMMMMCRDQRTPLINNTITTLPHCHLLQEVT